MNVEEYRKKYFINEDEQEAVGWLCIDEVLEKLYPNQEPRHYVSAMSYMLGGEDPLDGVSIYKSKKQQNHYHIVSYGMSNLYYDEEDVGKEYSGWGFEFTFRLAPFADDNDAPKWVVSLMQNLARYVYNSEKYFDEYHLMPCNSPIRLNTDTEITAIAFILDPEMQKIDTPHGEVKFLQMVGITSAEYEKLKQNFDILEVKKLVEELQKNNPLLITDLNRK